MGTMTDAAIHPAWRWPATGSTWHVHHSGGVDAAAAQAAAELVERDEARWSRFRPSSDVSQINRSAGRAVPVSRETLELLVACGYWTQRTGGVFQPLVGAVLQAWGYRESLLEQPAGTESSPGDHPVTGEIQLDIMAGTACCTRPTRSSTWVASQRAGWRGAWRTCSRTAATTTSSWSMPAATWRRHAGTTSSPSSARRLAAQPPGPADRRGCSAHRRRRGRGRRHLGLRARRWVNGDGEIAHHLIDPAAGRPGPRTQATVIAGDVVTADVLAKTLALRPRLIGVAAENGDDHGWRSHPHTRAWDRRVLRDRMGDRSCSAFVAFGCYTLVVAWGVLLAGRAWRPAAPQLAFHRFCRRWG